MILFDGRSIGPRLSGIGRYSLNLLRAIDRVGTEELGGPVRVWVRPDAELPEAIAASPHLDLIERRGEASSPAGLLVGHRELRRLGAAVYHCPDTFIPPRCGCRRVVTVHDVIPLVCRGLLRRSRKQKYLRLWRTWSSRQARSADAVITVSQHSAEDIRRVLGVPDAKLHVIPNAVPPRPEPPADAPAKLQALGLDGPFVLCVGRRDPYKNVDGLVRAFATLPTLSDRLPRGLKLAIVGEPDRRYRQAEAEAARLGLEDRVVFTGYVDEPTLAALYQHASLLAMPSLYEGFGLPAIEAMRAGLPVVAGAVASLPEVVGDAALLFDAHRPEALAEAMHKLLIDPALRRLMIERGQARAQAYELEPFGRAHLELYRRLRTSRPPAG